MSKRLHPAVKLSRAVSPWDLNTEARAAIIQRRVKPLLDALAREHGIRLGKIDLDPDCLVCRFLAEWKEPL